MRPEIEEFISGMTTWKDILLLPDGPRVTAGMLMLQGGKVDTPEEVRKLARVSIVLWQLRQFSCDNK